jgi:hypothetical protein
MTNHSLAQISRVNLSGFKLISHILLAFKIAPVLQIPVDAIFQLEDGDW